MRFPGLHMGFRMLLLAGFLPAGVLGVDRYVTPLGAGGKTGLDWGNAYSNVQSAVNDCVGSASTIYMLTGRYAVASQVGILNAVGLTFRGGCTGSGTTTTTNMPTIITRSGGNIRLLAATNSVLVFDNLTFTNGYLREGVVNRGFTIKLVTSQATFTNCAIRDNNANATSDSGQYGTGIYADRGTLTLHNCLFLNNQDPDEMAQYGGAVYAVSVGLTSRNSRFAGGTLRGNSAHGAGFYLLTCTNAWIEGCTFTSNSVRRYGGNGYGAAIYANNSPNLVITNSVFEYGISDGQGAAMSLTGVKQSTTVTGCELRYNASPGGPEDLYINTTNRVTLAHTIIRSGARDGIYLNVAGRLTLTNCLVAAMGRHGINASAGFIQAVNSTIADCAGWGINHAGSSLKVLDSIVWSNALGGVASPVLVMTNTCIQETHAGAGTGNFTGDPKFIAGYYLSTNGLSMQATNSPCRNAGSITATARGLANRTTMTDGTPDAGGSAVDLGYHYDGAYGENLTNLTLYVDLANGGDGNTGWAPGAGNALKHITAALAKAIDGTIIRVAAGVYSVANGETLPIEPQDDHVTVRGVSPAAVRIDGGAAARGVKVMGRGRFRLENVTVTNCLADNMRGGGLYVVGSDMTASNVVFTRNTNKSYADPGNADAGLQVCVTGGRLTMIDSDIDNAAKAAGEAPYIKKGVGLYAENASLRLVRTTIRRNKYASNNNASGMGVHMTGGDGWFSGCTFEANGFNSLVAGNRGAAVYASGTVPLIFTNCNFTGNYGVGGRGVVCLGGSTLEALITGCVFSNNSYAAWSDTVLHDDGGSVVLDRTSLSGGSGSGFSQLGPTGNAALTNCLITTHTNNGIAVAGGTVRVVNCTTAGNSGWGAWHSAGSLTVQNTIAWSNAAGGILSAGGTISYTCSQEAQTGAGNLSINPLFEAPATGNYRLYKGSPCIDTCLNESWMYTAFDLDGRPRKWNVKADMGCYEAPIVSGTVLSLR